MDGFGESKEAFLGLWDPPKCEKSQKIEFFFFDFFDIFSDFSTDFLTLAPTRVGSPMPIHLGPGAQPHYVNTLDIFMRLFWVKRAISLKKTRLCVKNQG